MTALLTRTQTKRKPAVALQGLFLPVWGPLGSAGKSTLALNLAYEFAELGKRVLLIDLDTYVPSMNQLLPISKPTSGLAGVARLIRQGRFSFEELDRLSIQIIHKRNKFRLLTGLASSARWPEVTPETLQQLIKLATLYFDVVIADLASPIEDNLVGSEYVTKRNSVARTALQLADLVLVVLSGSQSFLARYLACVNELDELQKTRLILVNRSEPKQSLSRALVELTGERIFATIPNDEPSLQLAESQLLPLAVARRKSAARNAITALAHKLLAWQP